MPQKRRVPREEEVERLCDELDQLLKSSDQLQRLYRFWQTHMNCSVPWRVEVAPCEQLGQASNIACCVVPENRARKRLAAMTYVCAVRNEDASEVQFCEPVTVNITTDYAELFRAWSTLHYAPVRKELCSQHVPEQRVRESCERVRSFLDQPTPDTVDW